MTGYNPGTASTYAYDAFGPRVRAVTPAGTFDYDYDMSGALRGVWNESSGSRKQLETGLVAGTLETYNAAPPSGYSNFTYTGTSLLGSTAFRYNPGSGGIAKNYHFLPYGLEWPGEATDTTTNLKWTGHEQDSESGLYHFLFRNYSPLENRWLSPDPAGWAAADPADPFSRNRYTYVENTPLGSIDPLGLDCDPNNPGKAIPGTGPCVSGGSRTVVVAAPPPDPEAPFINPENPLYQLWWDSLPQLAEALGIGDFSKPVRGEACRPANIGYSAAKAAKADIAETAMPITISADRLCGSIQADEAILDVLHRRRCAGGHPLGRVLLHRRANGTLHGGC